MDFEKLLKEIVDENGNIPAENTNKLVEKFKDYNKGLAESKDKILSEKKALQEKIKVKQHEREYNELTERLSLKDNDAETNKKALTSKYEPKLKELEQKLNESESRYKQKVVNEKLNELLESVGVKKTTYKKAVSKLFEKDIQVIDDNILVGDKEISEFINDWSQSDEAKDFISAPISSGGGYKTTGENGRIAPEIASFKKGAGLN